MCLSSIFNANVEYASQCLSFWVPVLKGALALLVVLVYQLFCFLAFISFSIGFSVVVDRVYEYLMGSPFPSSCQQFACMYLLSVFAEFHIFCEEECVGRTMRSLYRNYKTFLPMGTCLIYSTLYFIAFAHLYICFREAHVEHIDAGNPKFKRRLPLAEEQGHPMENVAVTGASYEEQLSTCFFLLAFSYVVYCTMKIIHYDTIEQVKRITNQASCIHCVVTLGFVAVHFIINCFYSIPLMIVAFSLRMYETNGPNCFIELCVVAVISGMIFAVLETRKPWPTTRSLGPFFIYENNCRAKATLAQLLSILVLICYYRPFVYRVKIPEASFNAADENVLLFCFSVAFVILHYVKILVFVVVQKEAEEMNPPLDQNAEAHDEEDALGEGVGADHVQDANANVTIQECSSVCKICGRMRQDDDVGADADVNKDNQNPNLPQNEHEQDFNANLQEIQIIVDGMKDHICDLEMSQQLPPFPVNKSDGENCNCIFQKNSKEQISPMLLPILDNLNVTIAVEGENKKTEENKL